MTTITALLSGWWAEILAGLAFLVTIAASYFGGKKIGTTQTQAKADVTAANVESARVDAVAKKQSENIEVAKGVQIDNGNLADPDARNKLQQSKYHSDD